MTFQNMFSTALQATLAVVLLVVIVSPTPSSCQIKPQTFKAAVYEHAVIKPKISEFQVPSRAKALADMEVNLAVYREQTKRAKNQGASIIVFPEDGIYGYQFLTRSKVHNYLETIPDPRNVTWSPCNDPDRFPGTEVQRALSCMARNNSIYVVADMGDKQPCNTSNDAKCPADGWYQFNTAVAFDPTGTLVARYHKFNLFFEFQFNTPKSENIYFDTPFGRFGLLVCFDLLFSDPAVELVMKHNVTNIAFPTAWMDAMPLLSASGYHSSFARRFGVNLLSANLHIPAERFQGSGIHSPEGTKDFYYNNSNSSPGRLVVAELEILENRKEQHEPQCLNKGSLSTTDMGMSNAFKSGLFHDMWNFKTLDKDSGSISVYHNKVGCHLNYSKQSLGHQTELFALGAFDGLHTRNTNYYFQSCALVKCANTNDRLSCGNFTQTSSTIFHQLDLKGDIPTDYVYPQVVIHEQHTNIGLTTPEGWQYNHACRFLSTKSNLSKPILSAALQGRDFCRDRGNCQAQLPVVG